MANFILQQPPGRTVDFSECSLLDLKCGCLMIHYGQARGWNFSRVDSMRWTMIYRYNDASGGRRKETVAKLERMMKYNEFYSDRHYRRMISPRTYAELQEAVHEMFRIGELKKFAVYPIPGKEGDD